MHFYGKDVRPGRKIGHVNALAAPGELLADVRARASRVAAILRNGTDQPSADQESPKGMQ